jgi:hypothetical protein
VIGIDTILSLVKKIYQQSQEVKFNQAQAKRLAERLKVVQQTITNVKPKVQGNVFNAALEAVYKTLIKIELLLQKLSGKNWFKRAIHANRYKEKMRILSDELRDSLQQLNVGLNVQQLFDRAQDKQDWKIDLTSLKQHQQEMIKLQANHLKALEQLGKEKALARQIAKQQLQSYKGEIEQLFRPSSVKATANPMNFFARAEETNNLPVLANLAFCDFVFKKSWLNQTSWYEGEWAEQAVLLQWFQQLPHELLPAFKAESWRRYQWRNQHLLLFHGHCAELGQTCWVSDQPAYTLVKILGTEQLQDVINLAHQVATALHYLHRHQQCHGWLGINWIGFNNYGQVKLYGIRPASSTLANYLATMNSFESSWCAPEIPEMGGDGPVNAASDSYSFGLMLASLLLNQVLQSNKPADVMAAVKTKVTKKDKSLNTLLVTLESCLATRPDDRPTMKEILTQLQSVSLKSQPVVLPAKSIDETEEKNVEIKIIDDNNNNKKEPNNNSDDASGESVYQQGLKCEKKRELSTALVHYQKAVKLGHVKAKTNVAQFYLQGLGGCEKSAIKALSLLTQAAKAGHGRAQYNLGMLLEYGDNGVEINLTEALKWYQKAKAQNYQPPKGMKNVADKIMRLREKLEQLSFVPLQMGGPR